MTIATNILTEDNKGTGSRNISQTDYTNTVHNVNTCEEIGDANRIKPDPVPQTQDSDSDSDSDTIDGRHLVNKDDPLTESEQKELCEKFKSLHYELIHKGAVENATELLDILDILLEADLIRQADCMRGCTGCKITEKWLPDIMSGQNYFRPDSFSSVAKQVNRVKRVISSWGLGCAVSPLTGSWENFEIWTL